VVSVILLAAGSVAAVAPTLAGALLGRWSGGTAMLVFAVLVGVAAVAAGRSRGIRDKPSRQRGCADGPYAL
jgi:membrane protein implicated in regulation of membrane protease activity